MTKRSWRTVAFWDLALVGGPLVIAAILAFNGWIWGNVRSVLLAIYGLELFLMLLSGWGSEALRLRGKSYASFNAPAFNEVYAPPDRPVAQEAQKGPGIRDPIAIGPGISVVLLLLSVAIFH